MDLTSTASPMSRSHGSQTFSERLNTVWHERALQIFIFIVLAHWAEHLAQAFQIYVLKWPAPQARGVLGLWYPWLIKSEVLHYGYALVMLVGIWMLRPGFVGTARKWWTVALVIQFWHHIEHRAAARAGPSGTEPVQPAGADEHRAALDSPGGAAPDLQHDRLHPDGDRHVLPHVPTGGRSGPHEMHLCFPAASCRGLIRLSVVG